MKKGLFVTLLLLSVLESSSEMNAMKRDVNDSSREGMAPDKSRRKEEGPAAAAQVESYLVGVNKIDVSLLERSSLPWADQRYKKCIHYYALSGEKWFVSATQFIPELVRSEIVEVDSAVLAVLKDSVPQIESYDETGRRAPSSFFDRFKYDLESSQNGDLVEITVYSNNDHINYYKLNGRWYRGDLALLYECLRSGFLREASFVEPQSAAAAMFNLLAKRIEKSGFISCSIQ